MWQLLFRFRTHCVLLHFRYGHLICLLKTIKQNEYVAEAISFEQRKRKSIG